MKPDIQLKKFFEHDDRSYRFLMHISIMENRF